MPSRPVAAPTISTHVAGPPACASISALALDDADAHRVDQRVLGEARVEVDLAANGRHAEAVAVVADAGHDAVEQVPVAGLVERAEAQRVEQRDRPRAHGEDVAHDAADAGRRALVRLDGARMVVRLDLEDDRAGRRRCRPRRRSRPAPGPRAAPVGRETTQQWPRVSCSRSARSTSPTGCPPRRRWARGPRLSTICVYSASVRPGVGDGPASAAARGWSRASHLRRRRPVRRQPRQRAPPAPDQQPAVLAQ